MSQSENPTLQVSASKRSELGEAIIPQPASRDTMDTIPRTLQFRFVRISCTCTERRKKIHTPCYHENSLRQYLCLAPNKLFWKYCLARETD